MKILVLEDDNEKLNEILAVVRAAHCTPIVTTCHFFSHFLKEIQRAKYHLIIADLVVPILPDINPEPVDITNSLLDELRDRDCLNYSTPVIAITGFDALAEENFPTLNGQNITVVTYSKHSSDWQDSLTKKIVTLIPTPTYEFVIFCALKEEADGFSHAGYQVGTPEIYQNIAYRKITINGKNGIVVMPPRMGLVNCAITCARSIDIFSPKLICMSGICAGIRGRADIYTVVIPEICFQHDFGKWTDTGFNPEPYSVQLLSKFSQTIQQMLDDPNFIEEVKSGIVLKKSEYPEGIEEFQPKIVLAPASSGNAVLASKAHTDQISDIHRKVAAFEMESYALYEAARTSDSQPAYFSAKCVVDNGDGDKSDDFRRVASILSARAVGRIIEMLDFKI